jgi:hypothetical protein
MRALSNNPYLMFASILVAYFEVVNRGGLIKTMKSSGHHTELLETIWLMR